MITAPEGVDRGPAKKPAPDAPGFRLTDMGNGERFADQHRDRVRYCHSSRRWFAWDGRRWAADATGEIERLGKETVRSIDREAAETENDDRRRELRRWATTSERRGPFAGMLAFATSEEGIPVTLDQLDRDLWLFNVENGTLDLRTCELRPHRQADMITRLAPVPYDPDAECPRWERFVEEIMGGDPDLVSYLQRAIGYSLTGNTREHCLFFPYGTGRNGKSVFLGILQDLVGDYGVEIPAETLLAVKTTRAADARPDLMRLRGARLVAALEADQDRKLAEALVKQLTGQDVVAARALWSDYTEFRPEAKLWFAANHKPKIKGTDEAIWSRIHVIPFDQCFKGARADKDLAEKLRAELPGILRWAVEGCRTWLDVGLQPPDRVLEAVRVYREEQDVLGGFLAEECVEGERLRVPRGRLWNAYREWCVRNGEKPGGKSDFYSRIQERRGNFVKLGGILNVPGISLQGDDTQRDIQDDDLL